MTRRARCFIGMGLGLACLGAVAALFFWRHAERQRLLENERSADGMVGAVANALRTAGTPPLGTWTVDELGKSDLILPDLGAADPARPGATPYRGYWFTILPGRPGEQTVCAYPARYGRAGRNTFIYTPGNGHLHRDTGGIPPTSSPDEAALQREWAK